MTRNSSEGWIFSRLSPLPGFKTHRCGNSNIRFFNPSRREGHHLIFSPLSASFTHPLPHKLHTNSQFGLPSQILSQQHQPRRAVRRKYEGKMKIWEEARPIHIVTAMMHMIAYISVPQAHSFGGGGIYTHKNIKFSIYCTIPRSFDHHPSEEGHVSTNSTYDYFHYRKRKDSPSISHRSIGTISNPSRGPIITGTEYIYTV